MAKQQKPSKRPRRASVQVEDPLLERIEYLADAEQRTIAGMVRKLLTDAVSQRLVQQSVGHGA